MDKKKPPSHGADLLQTAIGGVEKKVEKSEHGADAHPTGHSGVSQNARYGVDAYPTGGGKEPIAEALVHGGDLFSTGGSSVRESARTAQALFFGRYEMLEKLGHGGMAEVWRVHDHQTKQDVALKRMSIHLQSNEEAQRRFFREITLLQGLKHPHIIAIYEASPEGFFFTMELLQGQDLRQFLLERKRLPLHLALSIFGQVGQALLVAHQAGVVHRDLKPENIFLLAEPPSFVKLLDFGIAVALEGTRMTMTQQGQLGTAYYMAPEQLHGEHQEVGAAADVYSCGVLLYELLTGRIPQIGAPPIHKHIERLEEKGQLGRDEFPPALRDAYYNHLKELEKAYQRAIPNDPEDRSPLHQLVTSVASSFSAWTQQRHQAAKQQIAQILAALEQSQEKQVIESLLPELRASFPEQAQVAEFSESLLQARQERDALVEQVSVEEAKGTPYWEERAALWQAATERAAYRALYTQHPFTMRLQEKQRGFAEAIKQSRSLAEHQSPVNASVAWKKQAYHFQAFKDWMALLERESERQRKCEEATQTFSQNLSDPWTLDALQEHLSFWECAATESAFPSFFREHPAIREFQEAVQEEANLRRLQQEGTPEDFFSSLQRAKGRVWPTALAELRASVEASQQEGLRLEKQTQAFLDAVQPKAWEEGEALKKQWEALASQDHIFAQCVQRNASYQRLNECLQQLTNRWKQLEAAVTKADFATFEALLNALKGYTSPQIEHYRQQYNAYQETYRKLENLLQNNPTDGRTTTDQYWKDFLKSTTLSTLFANSPVNTLFSWDKRRSICQKMLDNLDTCSVSPIAAKYDWEKYGESCNLSIDEKELWRRHLDNLDAINKAKPSSFLDEPALYFKNIKNTFSYLIGTEKNKPFLFEDTVFFLLAMISLIVSCVHIDLVFSTMFLRKSVPIVFLLLIIIQVLLIRSRLDKHTIRLNSSILLLKKHYKKIKIDPTTNLEVNLKKYNTINYKELAMNPDSLLPFLFYIKMFSYAISFYFLIIKNCYQCALVVLVPDLIIFVIFTATLNKPNDQQVN